MQIRQLMTSSVASCGPGSNLADVTKLMWDHDCGFIPVVDAAGKIAGVITDRDICIASATRRLLPEQITAAQAMRLPPIHSVQPEDSVETALKVMRDYRVRRLPVITGDGTLAGVVSMNDIILASQEKRGPSATEITAALAGICAHQSSRIAAA